MVDVTATVRAIHQIQAGLTPEQNGHMTRRVDDGMLYNQQLATEETSVQPNFFVPSKNICHAIVVDLSEFFVIKEKESRTYSGQRERVFVVSAAEAHPDAEVCPHPCAGHREGDRGPRQRPLPDSQRRPGISRRHRSIQSKQWNIDY